MFSEKVGSFKRFFLRCVVILPCLCLPGFFAMKAMAPASSPAATTTTLTVAGTLASAQVLTMTASVQSGGAAVTVGTVNFYDGQNCVGSVQVVRNTTLGFVVGTATLKKVLSVGTHTLVATFQPTASLAKSSSSSQMVTIAGTEPTVLTLAAAAGSGTASSLTATLTGLGASTPGGSVDFKNQTSSMDLGTVSAGSSTFARNYVPTSFAVSEPEFTIPTDLNNDGLTDLLTVTDPDARGTMLVPLINQGNGSFQTGNAVTGFPTGGVGSYAVADFNGDGIPDFAFPAQTNQFAGVGPGELSEIEVIVFSGTGNGTLSSPQVVVPAVKTGNGSAYGDLVTADFNGDGIPDMGFLDSSNATAPVFDIVLGKGDGTFSAPISSAVSVGISSIVAGDFNGDGYADLAITLTSGNSVQVMLGNGDGTFQPAVSYTAGTQPVLVTTLQSRGNGISDLEFYSVTDNSVGILLGKGDGTFQNGTEYSYVAGLPAGPGLPVLANAGDVTGDGIPDLIVLLYPGQTTSGAFGVFAGNGDGTFQTASFYPQPAVPSRIATADVNQDGVSDVIIPNPGGYTMGIYTAGLQATVPLSATVYGTGAQQVVATYSGDSHYAGSTSNAVSVTGQGAPPTPTYTLSLTSQTLSIAAGATGTVTLSVTPQNGFNSPVTFSCMGLPAYSTCSFAPASVTPNGAAVTTTLTIATNVSTTQSKLMPGPTNRSVTSWAMALIFLLPVGMRRFSKQKAHSKAFRMLALAGFFLLTATFVTGCSGSGSGGGTSIKTPAGTSAVTIVAAQSGSATPITTTLSLTVTN